jgi:hypothetical protein
MAMAMARAEHRLGQGQDQVSVSGVSRRDPCRIRAGRGHGNGSARGRPGLVLGRASAGQWEGKNRAALGHGRARIWHG